MARRPARTYNSPRREQQANQTRQRIAEAARKLILSNGLEKTTIEAIAQQAGVAEQTVYAVFGSKRGIIEALIERAAFGTGYQGLVQQARESEDPETRLRMAARIAGQIYDATRNEVELLRSANVVAPDIMRQKECVRWERQAHLIELLAKKDVLRAGVTPESARDILWTLTGRDLYRMLVLERGWTLERYTNWLGDTLVSALISPEKRATG